MKESVVLSVLIFLGTIAFSQEKKVDQSIPDPESGHHIMIGYCTLKGITDSVFTAAFRNEYDAYAPDREVISQIPSLLDDVTVTIVMGTWCSDSREQVPRFFRIFDMLEHAIPDPVLICADRDKKAGDVSLEGMNILKVPTIIVYHHNRELGRIIETPQTTMEQDFLDILKKQL